MQRIDPIARRHGTEPVEPVRPVLLSPLERELERKRREAARRRATAAATEAGKADQAADPRSGGLDIRA